MKDNSRMKIICLFLIGCLISSCKKENEINTQHHGKISQSLYPFLFDLGSYWVYKDSVTNILDSITLTSITKSTFTLDPNGPGQGPQGDEEYFNIKYLSFPSNEIYEEQLLGFVISRGLNRGGYTLLSSKKKGEKSLNAEIADVLDSLKVEETTYYNVVKMKISKDNYIKNDYFFYYVDSIGVIKKETTANDSILKTTNLLRFKTIMYNYQ